MIHLTSAPLKFVRNHVDRSDGNCRGELTNTEQHHKHPNRDAPTGQRYLLFSPRADLKGSMKGTTSASKNSKHRAAESEGRFLIGRPKVER
jgi:hypothetical protein